MAKELLPDDLEIIRQRLDTRLRKAAKFCAQQEAFYEGSSRVASLGISLPPRYESLSAVTAWPEIVVDVLDERSLWQGWWTESSADQIFLDRLFAENSLDVSVGQIILDSLICGQGFAVVGTGETARGEPPVIVTPESASRITGTWSPRLRRLTEAYGLTYDADDTENGWILYLLNETITAQKVNNEWEVINWDQHGMNRVPVLVCANRPRASRTGGRSEITRAIRSLTETGMRTLLGMEITREFYGAPQRYLLGASEDDFLDSDGNKIPGWDVLIGNLLAVARDENGDLPSVGTFQAASPQPFVELLKTLSQMVSAASGVPGTHLGFAADNPTSADALAEANSRLDNRAFRRQQQYNSGLIELAYCARLWAGDDAPQIPGSIASRWANPARITQASAADWTSKLVASGTLPPRGDVTLEGLGLDTTDIARVRADWVVADATDPATALSRLIGDGT